MEIKIEDYLNDQEIKEILESELRNEVKNFFRDEKNAQRLLSNLSFEIVFNEIDKVIPESREIIYSKTKELLQDVQNYSVFRGRNYGNSPSLAYTFMEEAVKDNKGLLNEKVREVIQNKDYSKEVWTKFEELGENFMSNIYEIVRLGRGGKIR